MPDWFPHTLAEAAVFVPLRIAFLIVAAIIFRAIALRLINRAVRRAIANHPKAHFRVTESLVQAVNAPTKRRAQRIGALGSLARSAVTIILFILVVMTILAELGFNITSAVAGTSVVAVTIAFGLQSMVKDLISGVFMLVEDQLGVGDYVDLDKASGVVEAIGLRVTQLRDDEDTVWYVRNGEVVRVGNFSQGGQRKSQVPG